MSFMPKVRFSTAYGGVSDKRYYEVNSQIKPGNAILAVDKAKLSSLFIPGKFSHAAIYSGHGSFYEMVGSGWKETSFFEFMKEYDEVMVIGTNLNLDLAWSLRHSKYDLEFEHNDKEFYCSEMVAYCDNRRELGQLQDKPIIYPDDILRAAIVHKLEIW